MPELVPSEHDRDRHTAASAAGAADRVGSPPRLTQQVIFIDPGQRAGWASATVGLNVLTDIAAGVLPLQNMALWLAAEQAIGWQGAVADVSELPRSTFDVIGYETWRLRPKKARQLIGDDMQASQLIGMIRLIAWLSGAKLVGLGPETKFVPSVKPEWLEKRKAESTEEHDKDALDLLYHWYFKNWFDPTQEIT